MADVTSFANGFEVGHDGAGAGCIAGREMGKILGELGKRDL